MLQMLHHVPDFAVSFGGDGVKVNRCGPLSRSATAMVSLETPKSSGSLWLRIEVSRISSGLVGVLG